MVVTGCSESKEILIEWIPLHCTTVSRFLLCLFHFVESVFWTLPNIYLSKSSSSYTILPFPNHYIIKYTFNVGVFVDLVKINHGKPLVIPKEILGNQNIYVYNWINIVSRFSCTKNFLQFPHFGGNNNNIEKNNFRKKFCLADYFMSNLTISQFQGPAGETCDLKCLAFGILRP